MLKPISTGSCSWETTAVAHGGNAFCQSCIAIPKLPTPYSLLPRNLGRNYLSQLRPAIYCK
ncbi:MULTISPECIES: hypothetical protein [Moorena]|uniref:Uncharacterized protein n=1 Tax=Moorena producens (strain JHB) TaxID=1454205 RepID=A0A9Q9SS75_MOOP1|nr:MULTISPECIES: hypothetical protein [Moorena]NEP65701.1 hypothetical protein [Moorena sp. SIO3A5]NES42031.1 hypothetical protein [Moorena sp. SIO2C4]WAN68710.1 hypothetical protein BJP36_40825 [Moorena producens JHB]